MQSFSRHGAGYESARRALIRREQPPDLFPRHIVQAHCAQDVAEAMKVAVAEGICATVRSGGHSSPQEWLPPDGLVVDASGLNAVQIDPQSHVAGLSGKRL